MPCTPRRLSSSGTCSTPPGKSTERFVVVLKTNWRWFVVLPVFFSIIAYQWYAVWVMWPEEGKQSAEVILKVQCGFYFPFLIMLVFVVSRLSHPDFNSLDFPSGAIRWHNWQNWVVLGTGCLDLFSMLTQLLPRATLPANSNLNTVFTPNWLSFGFSRNTATFWGSVGVVGVWLVLVTYVFYTFDVKKNREGVLRNKLVTKAFPVLGNSLFFTVCLNLMRALNDNKSPFNPGYGQTLAVQQTMATVALLCLTWYTWTAMLYSASLTARTDNAFADEQLDVKNQQAYTMLEASTKLLFSITAVLFESADSKLGITAKMSIMCILASILAYLNFMLQPCCITGYNVVRCAIFTMVAWACVASTIGVWAFNETLSSNLKNNQDNWVGVITMLSGWAVIGSLAGLYWKQNNRFWGLQRNSVYAWGFLPSDKEEEEWHSNARPKVVETVEPFAAVAAGGAAFSCAITAEGMLYSCGLNDRKQLGQGDDTYRYLFEPSPVLWNNKVVLKQISCGKEHAATVAENGLVFTFGNNDSAQLGHTNASGHPAPVRFDEPVVHVACGKSHTLFVMQQGSLFACGDNSFGQLGFIAGADGQVEYSSTDPALAKLNFACSTKFASGTYTGFKITTPAKVEIFDATSYVQQGGWSARERKKERLFRATVSTCFCLFSALAQKRYTVKARRWGRLPHNSHHAGRQRVVSTAPSMPVCSPL